VGSLRQTAPAVTLPLNTWIHVAAVLNNGVMRLLINGAEVATGTALAAPESAPTLPIGLGRIAGYPAFPGYARQVRFWNVARTAAQITAALGETLPTDRTGLVAAWPLDEAGGATAADLSGAERVLTAPGGGRLTMRTAVLEAGPFFTGNSLLLAGGLELPSLDDGVLIDFDSDGDADLVLLQIGPATVPETRTRLLAFRNDAGAFIDVTDAVLGDTTMVHPRHTFVGDFTGDGRPDLLVVGHGADTPPFPCEQAKIFIQTADGRLVEESATRLPQHLAFTHNVTSADIDGDGDLDIYTANLGLYDQSIGPRIYLNNGTGFFTETTDRIPAEIANHSGGHVYTACLFVDVNNDGHPDLVLGGDGDAPTNLLLINDGTGHFEPMSGYVLPPKIHGARAVTVAISSADFNVDGKPDLVLATTGGSITLPNLGGTIDGYGLPGLQLLLNQGNGSFSDVTATAGFTWSEKERWVIWPRVMDLDGDGRPDILAQVKSENSPGQISTGLRIFLNRAGVQFIDASAAFAGNQGLVFGLAGDSDHDGNMDLITANKTALTLARGGQTLGLFGSVPVIDTQPTNQAVVVGSSVSFAVAASGSPAFFYQWQKNGAKLDGETGAVLTLNNVQLANTASTFTVVIRNIAGAITSNPATLRVLTPFAAWQAAAFTADELADATKSGPNAVYGADALPNLVKYALGLEPKTNATAGLPQLTSTATEWVYTYTRPSATTEVNYAVEVSTNLTTWTTAGVEHEQVPSSGGKQTWRGRYPLGSGSTVFFRLKVTL
jgi:hypothetical protein